MNPPPAQVPGTDEPLPHFFDLYLPVFFLGIVALCFQCGLYFSGVAIQPGELADPDCYMRLVRVEQLASSGQWFNPILTRIDPPDGQQIHWSRPLDAILLAGALPLSLFVSFHDALFWWGVLVSPILQFAALFVLIWTVRPFFSERQRMLCCLIFLCQPALINYFQAGRPDHHGLLILLFLAASGTFLRALLSGHWKFFVLSGFLHALALWVGIEGCVAIALAASTLFFLWLAQPSMDRARQGLYWSLGLWLGMALALLLENPLNQIAQVQTDKIALPHLALATGGLVFWGVLAGWHRRNPALTRVSTIAISAGLGLILLFSIYQLFPPLFRGPLALIDRSILDLWLDYIPENRPLVASWWDWGSFMTWAFATPFSLALLLMVWKKKILPRPLVPLVFFLTLEIVVYLALAFWETRWIAYAETLLVLPLTAAAFKVQSWLELQGSPRMARLASPLVALVACAGFLPFLLLPTAPFGHPGPPTSYSASAPLTELAKALNQLPSGLVFVHFDFAPELLYRTHHSAICGPYHRSWRQLLFLQETMNQSDAAAGQKMLAQAGVRYLVLAPGSSEYQYYLQHRPQNTFYQQLLEGKIPLGLKPLSGLSVPGYEIFEVSSGARQQSDAP